ncbi:MAG: DUF4876 domain-containing protein [Bacteroidales bacterium]|nr:DUF4876 domain-containing protein [Bacteroidales bacterium]
MKRIVKFLGIVAVAAAALIAVSCDKEETAKNYNLSVKIIFPEGVEELEDLVVEAVKGTTTNTLELSAVDQAIVASASLPQGDYKVSASGAISSAKKAVGAAEVSLYADTEIEITLSIASASPIVIKAVQYTPGKQYYIQPLSDTWIELVNNSDEVQYLDQIILIGGMGRQTGPNAWQANGYENLYGGVTQSPVYAFPGNGTDYPLQPGASVVIANAPIDHSAQGEGFENCADLSKADWEFYASYNAKDTDYEGIPNMELVHCPFTSQLNWGQNFFAWAGLIAKLPEGVTPAQYAANEENLMTTPGTTASYQYLMIPSEYVLDAIDIWEADAEEHYPVFLPVDDAEGILGPEAWSGQAVRRKVTKIENGRAYYKDTNKSSDDLVVEKVVPGAVPTQVDAE